MLNKFIFVLVLEITAKSFFIAFDNIWFAYGGHAIFPTIQQGDNKIK
jgi:hypothetical protein